MKLLAILTTAACLQAAAHGYAQSISLTLRNAHIETAFREIKRQTGYRFVYTKAEMQASRPVTLQVSKKPLQEVLELLFADQPLEYVVEASHVVIRQKRETVSKAIPPVEIRGRVITEEGLALTGASVVIKGSGTGASTNASGEFSLPGIKETDVLVISSVGYLTREVTVGKQTQLLIVLSLVVNSLDETVVIAYGKTTKRLNTGSVGRVSAEQIAKQPVSNPLAALQGRVPGLLVTQSNGYNGSGFAILIRGQQSLLQGSEPFILIDGVPAVNGNNAINQINNAGFQLSPLNSLNPADIESIEVLKDADATALYGSRGANGVILITTKKGKAGRTSFQFNFYTGASRVTRTMDMLDTKSYLAMRREAFANDNVLANSVNAPDIFVFDTTRFTDFKKSLIGGTAHTLHTDFGINGGTENTQFRVNTGYHRESTVLPTTLANERFSVFTSVNHTNKRKNFSLNFSSGYSFNKDKLPAVDLSQYINLPPHLSLYDSLGNPNWREGTLTFRSLQLTNPLAQLNARYRGDFQNLTGNLQVSYEAVKGFILRLSAGFNSMSGDEIKTHPSGSIDPAFTSTTPFSFFANNNRRGWIAEPQVEVNRKISKGRLSVMAGATFQESVNSSVSISGSNYTNDLLLASVSGAGIVTADNARLQYKYNAFFGRIHYNYSDKYLLNLTGRRDGSSRFGPGRQFANFGAIGLGWVFSKEAFFSKMLKAISFGKVRFSHGVTGNDQIGDYQYLDTWSSNQQTYQGVSTLNPSRLYNPVYSWEENRKTEIGLDLGLMKDRVLLTANFYLNRSGNQLINYSLPIQTGFNSISKNLPALIENRGFELEINSKNILQKKFTWVTSFHLTMPRNKVIDFPGLSSSTYANTYIIGRSVNARARYEFLGVNPQSGVYEFTDANRDGIINLEDRIAIVDPDPRFYGGFFNSIKYHSFSLDLFFEFRKQTGRNYLAGLNVPGYRYINQPVIVRERWTQAGDLAPVQRFTAVTSSAAYQAATSLLGNSNAIYSDASFLRCKNVSVSWDFPVMLIRKMGGEKAQVYVQCQNLFVITGYKGADPENQSLLVLPPLKNITAGLQFNF
ncbi:MAG: SusC/RagA family TonB-linked outer membrane protein [Sphingobacteriales bacterium]|nr:SusC/RagA family TonB-linked outer membrane protein [Sphingobacteriales bacterium]